MSVRVWLVGFVVLFVGVELLAWVARLGSVGYWTMLGGLGLAAASNAKHLPRLNDAKGEADLGSGAPTLSGSAVDEVPKQGVDRSDDSISFRVRLPWR